MILGRFNSNKFKTQCKLCISRIKLMRNKRTLALKQTRKDVADLLRNNKQGNARIRVEAVIRETLLLQAYDILELFLELLAVRVPLLEKTKKMPADMVEALSSIVYAAQRITDFPELAVIRSLLGSKYGKEFVTEAASAEKCQLWHVNQNLIRCLAVEAPEPDEKLQTLSEIAQEFGVEWDAMSAARDLLPGGGQQAPNLLVTRASELPDLQGPDGVGHPPGGNGAAMNWSGAVASAQQVRPATPPPGWSPPPLVPMSQLPTQSSAQSQDSPRLQEAEEPTISLGKSDSGDIRATLFGGAGSAPTYTDANAAAAAARQYSEQARQAAEAAERLARGNGNSGGSGGQLGMPPRMPPPTDSLQPAARVGGGYVVRPDDEIQRDYDAVALADKQAPAPGPASAPVASAPPHMFSAPPPPAPGSSASQATGGPQVPPSPSSSIDNFSELDELTKRFEALKKR